MPRIVVFAGRGTSHSWTWFADFLERMGEYDARFLDSREFVDSIGEGPETVILSGGDGYAIAESLKGSGFARLKSFISRGGRYVGICAGAYLPLPSSLAPFDEFNVSSTKISNIDCSIASEADQPRRSVPYGSCSIIHPVRGEVGISYDRGATRAPLYGGPVFAEPEKDKVLLRYAGFGTDTDFQFDRGMAEAMVLGRPAGVLSEHGKGTLHLLGPHLEHPNYPEANRLLGDLLGIVPGERKEPKQVVAVPAPLARSLADLKVAAIGTEGRSFLVGKKLWDASRFLELAQAIEKRSWSLAPEEVDGLREDLDAVRGVLLGTKSRIESDVDDATVMLVNCTRVCVDSYFRSMVDGR